jgi:hypothetical protein
MATLCYLLEIPYVVSLHTRIDIYGSLFTGGWLPLWAAHFILVRQQPPTHTLRAVCRGLFHGFAMLPVY